MDSPLSTFAVQRAGNLPRSFADTGSALLSRARVCGRVVEVSEAGAFGAMSALCPLIAEVQARGEPVAWVEAGPSVFFPPDLHFLGIDVEAIPVFWSPEAKAGLQATDWLVRSGAFGLVVADWGTHKVDDALLSARALGAGTEHHGGLPDAKRVGGSLAGGLGLVAGGGLESPG